MADIVGKEEDAFKDNTRDGSASRAIPDALTGSAFEMVRMASNPLSYVHSDLVPLYRLMFPWLPPP